MLGLLCFIPTLPCPNLGFILGLFLTGGAVFCLSGSEFISKVFFMPWNSGSFIPLDFL